MSIHMIILTDIKPSGAFTYGAWSYPGTPPTTIFLNTKRKVYSIILTRIGSEVNTSNQFKVLFFIHMSGTGSKHILPAQSKVLFVNLSVMVGNWSKVYTCDQCKTLCTTKHLWLVGSILLLTSARGKYLV